MMHDDHQDFLSERSERISGYSSDDHLIASAQTFLKESLRAQYSYNFDWLGLPIIQYPQDLMALQEIIWKIQPDLIIETGIARGGSLIFHASMLELLGKDGFVVGIDIDLRQHNRKRILAHPLARRIKLLDGSSIASDMIASVAAFAKDKRCLVILDSNHTHEHVLAELEAYAPLVHIGGYCVVFDTIIEFMPSGHYQDRPWNRGNSPATAVAQFLKDHPEWLVDWSITDRLLISAAHGGYLRRVG